MGRVILDVNGTSSIKEDTFHTQIKLGEFYTEDMIVQHSKSKIEQHVERRVAQLYFQAVVCYNSDYLFSIGTTLHQGNQAQNINHLKFQAAHVATIPNLCTELGTYLYRSNYYDESNATDDLIEAVNQVDTNLDMFGFLRRKTLDLLNQASQRSINPEQVLVQFIKELLLVIKNSASKHKTILQIYQKTVEEIKITNKLTDGLLNLRIEDPQFSKIAKEIKEVIQRNLSPLRQDLLLMMEKKIEEVPYEILSERLRVHNEDRVPNHFKSLYYEAFLDYFRTGEDLKIVEEALSLSLENLKEEKKKFQRIEQTQNLLEQNADRIKNLANQLLPIVKYMQGSVLMWNQLEPILLSNKPNYIRPVVYKLRYEIIRKDETARSLIKSNAEHLKNSIRGKKKLPYFDYFFFHAIFEYAAASPPIRQSLSKLLSKSPTELKQIVTELRVNTSAFTTLEEKSSQISQLGAMIRKGTQEPAVIVNATKNLWCELVSKKNAKNMKLLFIKRLCNMMETDIQLASLQQVLNISLDQVDKLINVINSNSVLEANSFVKNNYQKIQQLYVNSKGVILTLNSEIQDFRKVSMKDLRKSSGMNFQDMADYYNKKHPEAPVTGLFFENCETSSIDSSAITKISEVLQIDQNLFKTGSFAEAD